MHLYTTVSVIPNRKECGKGMKAAPTAALRRWKSNERRGDEGKVRAR
jgi:hypothetical protein